MDYSKGYKSAFYAVLIDPASWQETERVELMSGSVNNTATGLRQSASLKVRDFDRSREYWLRVYMDARQGEDIDHVPLFTGIVSAPKEDVEGPIATNDLACYSVLEPLDQPLLIGYYIAKGMDAGKALRELLKLTPAPVDIPEDMPKLEDYIVAEDNETSLTLLDKVLDAINWRMYLAGDGTVTIRPKPTTAAAAFAAKGADVIESTFSKARDWFKAPNVYRVSSGSAVEVARDDNPASPLSTVSRGREVVETERDVTLGSNEGLKAYAERKLKEAQQIAETADYTRRFIPTVHVGDLVRINYDRLQGTYEVLSQTINLTYNGQTQEQVERVSEVEWTEIEERKFWYALVMPEDKYLVMPDGALLLMPVKTIITN